MLTNYRAWNRRELDEGGRSLAGDGYIRVRCDGKEDREHRVIAAEMLGRELLEGEVVHHKNHVRSDNRPENLEVLPSQSAHMKEHVTSEIARERALRTRVSKQKRARAALSALEAK